MESQSPCEFELLLAPVDKPPIDASVRASPVLHPGGKASGLRWAFRNITPQQQAERALQASLPQVHQAERLASIGTLAAGIAHEISNPLQAITLCSQYALQCGREAGIQDLLETIGQEARRAGQIVKGLLTFARAERAPKTAVDFNDVVRRAADLARAHFPPERLRLELRLVRRVPEILLNGAEIEQVLINLVRNAVEAARGPAHVIISTVLDPDGLRLIVEDDGPGIPREHLQRIFDPFFTTRQVEGGAGLGLSIAHGIVMDHGGSITVRNRGGRGAAFTIRLPVPGRG
jgi:C4-dicarboxylate-specific signal transduction histidine kinase